MLPPCPPRRRSIVQLICRAGETVMTTSQVHKNTETEDHVRGTLVQGEIKEQWMRLCEMAAAEQDSEKLLEIVKEINRLLEEKERRLAKLRQPAESKND